MNRSILETIFDEMFSIIEKKDVFNKESIETLKTLAYNERYKTERSITEVIENLEEDEE